MSDAAKVAAFKEAITRGRFEVVFPAEDLRLALGALVAMGSRRANAQASARARRR